MDKLARKIREVEEQAAEEAVNQHLENWSQRERDRALVVIGGFKAVNRLLTSVNSQLMRALEKFQEQKLYRSLGFEVFVDFLEKSEYSPMGKSQYYERKRLLDIEGDRLFEVFEGIGLPVRTRKLLGRGQVELEGENIIVHDGEETHEIEITDRKRILETLSALADSLAAKSAKIQKQAERIDRHESEKSQLYEEIDRVRAARSPESGDNHSVALVGVCTSFAALREQAAVLSEIDRAARRDRVLEILANQMILTAEAYGSGDWTRYTNSAAEITVEPDSDFAREAIEFFNKVEREDDNDAELAAAM